MELENTQPPLMTTEFMTLLIDTISVLYSFLVWFDYSNKEITTLYKHRQFSNSMRTINISVPYE